jgi:hypothetical protein
MLDGARMLMAALRPEDAAHKHRCAPFSFRVSQLSGWRVKTAPAGMVQMFEVDEWHHGLSGLMGIISTVSRG